MCSLQNPVLFCCGATKTMSVEQSRQLRARLERLLGPGKALRDIGGHVFSPQAAQRSRRRRVSRERVLEKLETGRSLTAAEVFYAESILLPTLRPVIDVVDNSYALVTHDEWIHLNDAPVKARLEAAIPAVGRIEHVGNGAPKHIGTGFIAGPGLMVTNRHVAGVFAIGVGTRGLGFARATDRLNLVREIDRRDDTSLSFRFKKVVMVHPYWDLAVIEVDGLPPDVAPLKLAADPAEAAKDTNAAIVGYPGFDPGEPAAVQREIMRHTFDVKRLQPGRVGEPGIMDDPAAADMPFFRRDARCLPHDSSTLTGNSGSPIVSLETGHVIGVHFRGQPPEWNWSIPASEIARDRRVAEVGIGFVGGVVDDGPRPWEAFWSNIEPPPQG